MNFPEANKFRLIMFVREIFENENLSCVSSVFGRMTLPVPPSLTDCQSTVRFDKISKEFIVPFLRFTEILFSHLQGDKVICRKTDRLVGGSVSSGLLKRKEELCIIS